MSSLRDNYARVANANKIRFSASLSDTGAKGGNIELAVNGSIENVDFWVQPDPGFVATITEFHIMLSDSGNPGLKDYGGITNGLTKGLAIFVESEGVQLIEGEPRKQNDQFMTDSDSMEILDTSGSAGAAIYRFLIHPETGGIRLDGSKNEKFGVIVQDDLSTITSHFAYAKGFIQLNDAN